MFSLSDYSVPTRTAMIPLVAHAQARGLHPDLDFADPVAERIVAALDIPLDTFGADQSWLRGTIIRARWFDSRCRRFFSTHPKALGVALGAGLDSRFQRLDNGALRWVDIDLPEVISLKRRFFKGTSRYRMLAGDVTDHAWMDSISWRPGTPLLLVAEGILMYLAPVDVHALLRGIAARFSDGAAPVSVLFDYVSPLLILGSHLHPAVRHTSARFRWGLMGGAAIRLLESRFRVAEDRDIASQCGFPTVFFSLAHQIATMGHPLYGLAHLQLARPS